ncbi:DUF3455 domain-containing protein [Streptomyces sp. NPDC048527]|uniref:DUF3455 domain-containing protein n=1 Tax=Streptomyces sp. NPDC048527 TaxID=3365568 RepID=UPI0037226F7F
MVQAKHGKRLARLAVGLTAVVAGVIGSAGSSWAASSPIDVPAGNHLVRVVHAEGQQIYQCTQNATDGSYSWTLARPAAVLLNGYGTVFGYHTYTLYKPSGQMVPTWAALDGSWVQAVKASSVASPDGAANIPWVLLQRVASGSQHGSTLTATTYVQRTNTVGGVAPSTTCDQTNAGTEKGIDYQADYSFYEASAQG